MQIEKSDSLELKTIREELQQLKTRITRLEASFDMQKGTKNQIPAIGSEQPDDDFELNFSSKSDDSIEFRVGEYGMAWLGNIVLLFGISFLVQYLQNSGYKVFSALIGFILVGGIYAGAYYTRQSLSYLSKLFAYTGHLLLFYMALRLHFFQDEPLIPNKLAGLFVLVLVPGVLLYLSFGRKSQLLAGIALLMLLFSGIISNSIPFASGITTLVALLSVILFYRLGWLKIVFIFIFLIYLSHFNWLLNSPFVGNKFEFIQSPGIGYFHLFATGFIISILALLPKKEDVSDDFITTSVVWNGLLFTLVLALTVVTYLSHNYVPVFAVLAIVCLVYSVVLQSRSYLKITASMYALYGFLALSVAFYGILFFPKVYMLLALQSLLVVSMALWFGSRFIVVMNTILFLILMIFYLSSQGNHSPTNFSFMLVAIITARIINLKKERLNIKTEHIRNLYLVLGFLMTLIAFYHAFPPSYITVSWIFAALLFFIVGRLINNIKYRWLAIGILIVSAVKLIFVDLSDLDIGFRVLVFLLLAIISISVSILYTKYLVKKKD
ncbi:MAG: hypothetical protein Q8S54_10865 [Bacteroidota bacterium]|nr:hypothetical protein [Odoribacter sp.]MDP3643676.1 hypothetical protein [Bacteroidota bacterium]